MGRRDVAAKVLAKAGPPGVGAWVALRPGKPVLIALCQESLCLACQGILFRPVTFDLFVKPALISC